jgi:hypothetical protein
MDQTTKQNAALVEEAAASSAMQDQAQQLAQVVSVFDLGSGQAAGRPAPARRAYPAISSFNEAMSIT